MPAMHGPAVHAPDFGRYELPWFNVPSRLSLADLAGRLVILDFWTFCCINCMQVLPTLRRVEEAFPDEVVVIGVHSPKFAAERDPENLRAAIARYDIRHPVVHDPEMIIWRQYAVRAWPTLVFISPDGHVLGQAPGEPDADRLLEVVARVVAEGRRDGSVRGEPLDLDLPPTRLSPLLFPGKIKALPGTNGTGQWAIADAGHHQVALLDGEGKVRTRYGAGTPGFDDGAASVATFNAPQGLVADSRAIYVADTGNHAIRRVDRATGAVDTVAGTGRRGPRLGQPQRARDAVLASPWDLERHGDLLYFANAGTHQLGVIDLRSGTISPLAGTGAEDIHDGPADEALLAQPSGLALDASGTRLAFADSETSSVRILEIGRMLTVRTLIGTGLFDFGHRNGGFGEALLQHPLGIAWLDDQRLVVADSYNCQVRVLDLASEQATDLDNGFTCLDAICLPLAEPAGVAIAADGRVLVSDTNNHRIVAFDLAARTSRTLAGT
jgi:thiol-disulfide isomerase/thioredoxin